MDLGVYVLEMWVQCNVVCGTMLLAAVPLKELASDANCNRYFAHTNHVH